MWQAETWWNKFNIRYIRFVQQLLQNVINSLITITNSQVNDSKLELQFKSVVVL